MKQALPAAEPQRPARPQPRRVKLQHILFLLLLLPGTVPLMISAFHLVGTNKEILETKERELLAISAEGFVNALSSGLAHHRQGLQELGGGLVAAPGLSTVESRLRETWVNEQLLRYASEQRDLLAFRALNREGKGLRWPSGDSAESELDERLDEAMNDSFAAAVGPQEPVYRFTMSSDGRPAVALAVPVAAAGSDEVLVMQSLTRLQVPASRNARLNLDDVFLIDAEGSLLWTAGEHTELENALLESQEMEEQILRATSVTQDSELEVGGETVAVLVHIVPIAATGWAVVAHKEKEEAFVVVDELVFDIVRASLVAVLLALLIALVAARWFSRPIQVLAQTSHEIAAGHFDRRVPTTGLSFEIAELAGDFNRMSDYVESYVERLKRAAAANRTLFISSIRAFAAAIDAKDPYTRGHSERVAAYSRSIARYLGLAKETQEMIWISALLHDVGKIGVEDRILQKVGVLTTEEFDQMKLHPVIGADIVEPILALSDMLPGIKWHHEAWNGSGYPDRLKGEQIPLMARIIGVADTFDAITTNRPYQSASSPEYALQTIKKLVGSKFDAKIVTAFLIAWEADHIKMDRERAERRTRKMAMPVSKAAAS